MQGPINVKSPNNISEWQMGFNSAFKGLIQQTQNWKSKMDGDTRHSVFPPHSSHCQKLQRFRYRMCPWNRHTALKTVNILYRTEVWTWYSLYHSQDCPSLWKWQTPVIRHLVPCIPHNHKHSDSQSDLYLTATKTTMVMMMMMMMMSSDQCFFQIITYSWHYWFTVKDNKMSLETCMHECTMRRKWWPHGDREQRDGDVMTQNISDSINSFFFFTHGSLHHESMLIKRSNLMQQYAGIYLLQGHSTCFGCHSTHHQEH